MVRKFLFVAVISLLLFPISSGVAYGASVAKYANQKAGQFCKNLDIGKSVTLPNGSRLKCVISTGVMKPKWKALFVAPIAVPVTSPTDHAMCVPRSLPTLPVASNRISIIKMDWTRESTGYVSVYLTMRNDNDANLRVIQYRFFYWYGSERRTTAFSYQSTYGTTTVEHFFSQDTDKLMGVDNIAGAWLAGQTRAFLIDTAMILD